MSENDEREKPEYFSGHAPGGVISSEPVTAGPPKDSEPDAAPVDANPEDND